MSPVQYIKRTREQFEKQGFPPYQWTQNPDCPFWTSLKKPLNKCRVALLSTGGFYIRDKQTPFNPDRDDLTFREIPKDVDPDTLSISHNNYKHEDAESDVNTIFPVQRMRDLEREGYIGEFASNAYTMMGRIFKRTQLQKELAPQILQKLRDAKVDVLLLVPA